MFQGPNSDIVKYEKYTYSIETVQQNGRFTLFSSKFHSNIYSIPFGNIPISSRTGVNKYDPSPSPFCP